MRNFGICIRYRELKNVEAILEKWHEIYVSFSEKFPNDGLHWCNERASISTLAGAAWKAGEFCLEEYSITKVKSKERRLGRADLWFTCESNEYYIEAKQVWVSLSKKARSSIQKIKDALKSAKKDAGRVRGKSGKWHSLGIVFAVPYLALSKEEYLDERLEMFMDEIKKINYDIMAYAFPPGYRGLKYNGDIYPGVVLIGKVPRTR